VTWFVPFVLGQGASIQSACFVCQKAVTVEVHEGLLQRATPTTTVIWSSERHGCCVAEVRCPLMNFFCDEGHLRIWLATSSDEQGMSLSLGEAFEGGKATFGELLR